MNNPYQSIIARAMRTERVAIVLPDTDAGRAEATRRLRAHHGDRLLGVYKRGGFRGSRAHLTAYYPRLRRQAAAAGAGQ